MLAFHPGRNAVLIPHAFQANTRLSKDMDCFVLNGSIRALGVFHDQGKTASLACPACAQSLQATDCVKHGRSKAASNNILEY
jgi:hypothetical protein